MSNEKEVLPASVSAEDTPNKLSENELDNVAGGAGPNLVSSMPIASGVAGGFWAGVDGKYSSGDSILPTVGNSSSTPILFPTKPKTF